MIDTPQFWESRAQRFAGEGAGLRAVCSYAMPGFYNWSLDVTQRAALRALIDSVKPGDRVLDFGCGVGRWSRAFARRGAAVTAVDFSATMLAEAERRARLEALETCCRFIHCDVTRLDIPEEFDLVFGVTVLQHVLDDADLKQTVARLARHVTPGGRLVLLEAAPTEATGRADTDTFQARALAQYVAAIRAAGLQLAEIRGVDPAPFKVWVVPRFRRWPRPLASSALALATLCSLPVDLLLARHLTRFSWHKLMVARAPGGVS